ncbi:hypothetical protein PoB_002272200 [Plakobranchus ocellatus]|uniref:Uncharacterized protein n=1 Tax=Plakobranchus ocellatus TaxID=259542 RepID=A0AAV3ZNX4_9GAST|nr:hypothetical protein PoB_002272200 [Plakobranchus ocellatus]
MHCPISLPLSQCTAWSLFHCDNALSDQCSTFTLHCPVSLPLSRCIARSVSLTVMTPCPTSLSLSRCTPRSVFCHVMLPDPNVTMYCPVSLPLSRCTARSLFHVTVQSLIRHLTRCTAWSIFHRHLALPFTLTCHDALPGQSSIVTMYCPVKLPLSRCTVRSLFPVTVHSLLRHL